MIELNKIKVGDNYHDTFTLLNDGICSTKSKAGWVEMTCRLTDMEIEGVALLIDVTDDKVAKDGDYSPLSMDKSELKQFIDYLSECHEKMIESEIK